jgi:predicted ATPase
MSSSPTQFARLLTDALYRIRLRESRPIGVIQDELGYALGRQGGSAIEYWRKGNVPRDASDVEQLARLLLRRAALDEAWLTGLLSSAGYEDADALHAELFATAAPAVLPHNLPPQVTPFIGRAAELRQVIAQLSDATCRVLTLLGPGGIGKTRLSIEVGLALAQAPPPGLTLANGIYFVPLATANDRGEIVEAIANALRLTFRSQAAPTTQMIEHLAPRELLLILDNFDHLIDHVDLPVELVRNAPGVRLLITSRERLNIHGEWVFPLQGLPVVVRAPARDADALALFSTAARRQQPEFVLTPETSPAAERICRLVDGLPLALELAAAWTRLLTVEEIAGEIERTLDFLSTSQRDRPDRHRSLRAVFDSSWERLSPRERDAFRRLSVFRGGFDRQAAENVAGADLTLLSAFSDKSLVRVVRDESPARYDLHEMLRQYGAEQLANEPTGELAVRARHAAAYSGRLRALVPSLREMNLRRLLVEVTPDLENVRVAWYWAAAHGRADLVLQAQDSLWLYYELRSRIHDGAALFAAAAEGLTPGTTAHATTLARQAWFVTRLGRHDAAEALLARSIGTLGETRAEAQLPFVLLTRAVNHYARGDYAAAAAGLQACFQESLARDDRFFLAVTRVVMGNVARTAGDAVNARRLLEEAGATLGDMGNELGLAIVGNILGGIAFEQKEYAAAADHYRAGLELCRAIEYELGVAMNEAELGRALLAQGEREPARRLLRAALQTALEMQALPTALRVALGLAELLSNEPDRAGLSAILRLVDAHPAADRKTRERSRELLAELGDAVSHEEDRQPVPSEQITADFVQQARELLARVD